MSFVKVLGAAARYAPKQTAAVWLDGSRGGIVRKGPFRSRVGLSDACRPYGKRVDDFFSVDKAISANKTTSATRVPLHAALPEKATETRDYVTRDTGGGPYLVELKTHSKDNDNKSDKCRTISYHPKSFDETVRLLCKCIAPFSSAPRFITKRTLEVLLYPF